MEFCQEVLGLVDWRNGGTYGVIYLIVSYILGFFMVRKHSREKAFNDPCDVDWTVFLGPMLWSISPIAAVYWVLIINNERKVK